MGQKSGIDYFFSGFNLIMRPGIRAFVIIPLSINVLLFGAAFFYLFSQVTPLVEYLTGILPESLSWLEEGLSYIVWPIVLAIMLLFTALVFGTITNWIAAPFNGLLSERVEMILTGQEIEGGGLMDIIKDIPRTLGREFVKLGYYLPRAIVFLIVFFMLPVFGQIIWFLFTAWMMAIQYCDYPFDNHKISFNTMKNQLLTQRKDCFLFGITVTFFSMIPIANLVVMPVAICGATSMWVDKFREDAL